jgi:hypothetical protein
MIVRRFHSVRLTYRRLKQIQEGFQSGEVDPKCDRYSRKELVHPREQNDKRRQECPHPEI